MRYFVMSKFLTKEALLEEKVEYLTKAIENKIKENCPPDKDGSRCDAMEDCCECWVNWFNELI